MYTTLLCRGRWLWRLRAFCRGRRGWSIAVSETVLYVWKFSVLMECYSTAVTNATTPCVQEVCARLAVKNEVICSVPSIECTWKWNSGPTVFHVTWHVVNILVLIYWRWSSERHVSKSVEVKIINKNISWRAKIEIKDNIKQLQNEQ